MDGTVAAGHTYVDQAAITGESMPVAKGVGDHVYAGTVNDAGSVEVRAEGIGRDTSFGRIIEAVERAEHVRAPIQRHRRPPRRVPGLLRRGAAPC